MPRIIVGGTAVWRWALAAVVVFGLAGCGGVSREGVLVHATAGPGNSHRLLMALRMADLMSEEGARDVIVYCDIDAVHALVKTAPDVALAPFPTLDELLGRLSKRGVRVMACPSCLLSAGLGEKDLREGVTVAEKDAFFSFTKGRILTLDY